MRVRGRYVEPMRTGTISRSTKETSIDVTVNLDGIFWHPLSTDADMQVSKTMFPLARAVERVKSQLEAIAATGEAPLMTFT